MSLGEWAGGGGELLDKILYGEAPPKRDTFFRIRLNERVGISLVEVYIKRIRKHVVKGP